MLSATGGSPAGYNSSRDGIDPKIANIGNPGSLKPVDFLLNGMRPAAFGQHANVEAEQRVIQRAGLVFIGAETVDDNAAARLAFTALLTRALLMSASYMCRILAIRTKTN